MRGLPLSQFALPVVLGLALAGCGGSKPAGDHGDHTQGDAHGHEEGEAAVQFKEGQGLLLSAETAASLGLKTAEITERSVVPRYEVTAAVFDAGPPARASAIVPAAWPTSW
jgi:hypothetical protein